MFGQLYVAGHLVWNGVLNSNGEYSSFSPSFYIPIGMIVSWQVSGMDGATVYDDHLEVHD